MKNKQILTLVLLISVLFSCREVPPPIDFTPTVYGLIDTAFINASPDSAQDRVVLLEESTGVACFNCPKGHQKGSLISSKYPGRIALVYLHTGFLARPYESSLYDFRTPEATAVLLLLGNSGVQPTAAIDRKIHPSESTILVGTLNSWEALVDMQIPLKPIVNIDIESRYQAPNLISKVTLQFNEDLTASSDSDAIISLFVTESGIVDWQLDDTVWVSNYVHDHVLRGMMGSVTGNVIETSKVAGRTVIKEYSIPMNSAWNKDNLNVVAIVHRGLGSATKEVLQAAESDVQ